MRLICPACGAIASAEAWVNDGMARSCLQQVTKLPAAVQDLALPYLGLFRQGAKGLTWQRAYRLIADLKVLIDPGTVQWDNSEVRPCPPHVWAAAIGAVLERRPKSLTNHNYLRHTAWDMAAGAAGHAERERERAKVARGEPFDTSGRTGGDEGGAPAKEDSMTEEERRTVLEQLKQFGKRFGGQKEDA